jgi:hypothetical protein
MGRTATLLRADCTQKPPGSLPPASELRAYRVGGRLVGPSPAIAAWAIEVGLSAIRAAAARHHFQTLDFLANGFVEDGVG